MSPAERARAIDREHRLAIDREARVRDIIDRLGGEGRVIAGLGLTPFHRRVGMWINRGYIPSRQWAALIDLARLQGVPLTWDELASTVEAAGHDPARAA